MLVEVFMDNPQRPLVLTSLTPIMLPALTPYHLHPTYSLAAKILPTPTALHFLYNCLVAMILMHLYRERNIFWRITI